MNISLAKHLAKEIKDPLQAEIITEMVASWVESNAGKFLYFDDDDPCNCGDQNGSGTRPREAVAFLAEDIRQNRVVVNHSNGECTDDDDNDEEEDDD